ncbi:hypothetical protein CYLTODRAFT_266214 [Cylindrobasidium torrendii FP15055 ss-10]|uniref:Uncharacterized protein n=1 Tax=Cylindrobasidium torrendii FP15055 ss-10 TaxID=1314674 RepID=A0A0D7BCH6_9AGAR|nr:hypothetical protein CYLTODRAFT_266214 [Cylindrobasidium torrendii FP15055 ss-10]
MTVILAAALMELENALSVGKSMSQHAITHVFLFWKMSLCLPRPHTPSQDASHCIPGRFILCYGNLDNKISSEIRSFSAIGNAGKCFSCIPTCTTRPAEMKNENV